MHIRLLAVLLAALLTLGEGMLQTRARTPEPAKSPEEAIAYIGQTGAELRQTLNGGEEPWVSTGRTQGAMPSAWRGWTASFPSPGRSWTMDRAPTRPAA